MRIFIVLFINALVVMAGISAVAQEPTEQAKRALSQFQKIAKQKDNWKRLGLKSTSDIGNVQLGNPMRVHMVRLDHLKKFKPGRGDPNELIRAVDQYIYPMVLERQAQASFYIEKIKGEWKATGFGSQKLSQMAARVRQSISKSRRVAEKEISIVQIPALNLYFLAYQAENAKSSDSKATSLKRASSIKRATSIKQATSTKQWMLTPLIDEKIFGFKAGRTMSADDVLRKILPTARKLKDLPT